MPILRKFASPPKISNEKRSVGPPGPPAAIGEAFGGGFFAGQISTAGNGIADYNLVVAPKSSGESTLAWKNTNTATAGADSTINGPQNTADMVADGNSTVYPCAHFCNDLVIGGFSDWYMPAYYETELFYFNLKPNTSLNRTGDGFTGNPNSVPARTTEYTSGNPAQTSVSAFQIGNAEAFTNGTYWSSSEFSSIYARRQTMDNGFSVGGRYKFDSVKIRAARRVAV